jgi:SAM-dependent methyltransferase
MSNASAVFEDYGRYYDLLYQDKSYPAEAEYIGSLLKRWEVSGRDLLEFGSGTGKHGRLLAERGYRVLGIERSAEMAARAPTSPGFTCEQGDICGVRVGRSFDAVLALFHVVSYQASDDNAQAVFARAAEHLRPGGLFLFDVWHAPAVLAQQPSIRVKRVQAGPTKVVRIAEPQMHPERNCVTVNYTLFTSEDNGMQWRSTEESHLMRYFDAEEIEQLCRSKGMRLLGSEEWLTGGRPATSTWGVCYVAQKE